MNQHTVYRLTIPTMNAVASNRETGVTQGHGAARTEICQHRCSPGCRKCWSCSWWSLACLSVVCIRVDSTWRCTPYMVSGEPNSSRSSPCSILPSCKYRLSHRSFCMPRLQKPYGKVLNQLNEIIIIYLYVIALISIQLLFINSY